MMATKERLPQGQRVLLLLEARGEQGVTQADFMPPNVADDGEPIWRLASRIDELRNHHAVDIKATTGEGGMARYRLAPGAGLKIPDFDRGELEDVPEPEQLALGEDRSQLDRAREVVRSIVPEGDVERAAAFLVRFRAENPDVKIGRRELLAALRPVGACAVVDDWRS